MGLFAPREPPSGRLRFCPGPQPSQRKPFDFLLARARGSCRRAHCAQGVGAGLDAAAMFAGACFGALLCTGGLTAQSVAFRAASSGAGGAGRHGLHPRRATGTLCGPFHRRSSWPKGFIGESPAGRGPLGLTSLVPVVTPRSGHLGAMFGAAGWDFPQHLCAWILAAQRSPCSPFLS